MPPFKQQLFLYELMEQADEVEHLWREFTLHATEWTALVGDRKDIVGSPAARNPAAQMRAQAGMFTAIEGLLTAVGRMSLILFPTARAEAARLRGRQLRDLLGIDEAHAIADRGLRNDWIHFDERMDARLLQTRNLRTQSFQRSVDFNERLKNECLRLFLPDIVEVWILGRRLDALGLVKGVQEIATRAAGALEEIS